MSGAVNKHVLEGRFSKGYGLNVAGERRDKLRDPLMTLRQLQADGAVDCLGVHGKSLVDGRGELGGAVGLYGDRIAADFGPQRIGLAQGGKPSVVHDGDAVDGPLGFFEQVSSEHYGDAVLVAQLSQ